MKVVFSFIGLFFTGLWVILASAYIPSQIQLPKESFTAVKAPSAQISLGFAGTYLVDRFPLDNMLLVPIDALSHSVNYVQGTVASNRSPSKVAMSKQQDRFNQCVKLERHFSGKEIDITNKTYSVEEYLLTRTSLETFLVVNNGAVILLGENYPVYLYDNLGEGVFQVYDPFTESYYFMYFSSNEKFEVTIWGAIYSKGSVYQSYA